ncbi:hypothetical protein [Pedobacter sp. SYP-B3415]|uniref:hypothetical protein n=1 Tax=Pedobacter sp. SYP-B3415 TaxID=2496641 RepID=UPI00101B77B6|nr:hypothetical protein [Pedobacter sp. SYP-B3415]
MNLTQEALFAALTKPLSKKAIEHLASTVAANHAAALLLDLSFDVNPQVAFRAAWILENLCYHHADSFAVVADAFIRRFERQQNHSAQRHFAKILTMISRLKTGKVNKLTLENQEMLTRPVFDWLLDGMVPVAVKSHCIQILANFSVQQPWIREELLNTLDFLESSHSIAFFAKAKQIRKQFQKM